MSEDTETKGSLLLAWQVKDKHCLVIGSGNVALSRIVHLVRANAKITVITGEGNIDPEILQLNKQGKIFKLISRNYQPSDLTMYEDSNLNLKNLDLDNLSPEVYEKIDNYVYNQRFETVCCCIDDYDTSLKVYYQCKLLKLNVNIADKPKYCDFYFGSMYNQKNLQIMVSTNGKSPRLSKIVKDRIAKEFDDIDLNKAVENLGFVRSRLKIHVPINENDVESIEDRMNWVKTLTDFFSLRQWSELDLISSHEDNKYIYVDNIVKYFPGFPPNDFEEFKKILPIIDPDFQIGKLSIKD